MDTTATMGPFLLERVTCPVDLSLQAPTELLSTLQGLPFPQAQDQHSKVKRQQAAGLLEQQCQASFLQGTQ